MRTERRVTAGKRIYVGVYDGGRLIRVFSVYRRSDLRREQRRSLWRPGKPATLTVAAALAALGEAQRR
jgi:hypothetical protein